MTSKVEDSVEEKMKDLLLSLDLPQSGNLAFLETKVKSLVVSMKRKTREMLVKTLVESEKMISVMILTERVKRKRIKREKRRKRRRKESQIRIKNRIRRRRRRKKRIVRW
jgi:hypothetical protein